MLELELELAEKVSFGRRIWQVFDVYAPRFSLSFSWMWLWYILGLTSSDQSAHQASEFYYIRIIRNHQWLKPTVRISCSLFNVLLIPRDQGKLDLESWVLEDRKFCSFSFLFSCQSFCLARLGFSFFLTLFGSQANHH